MTSMQKTALPTQHQPPCGGRGDSLRARPHWPRGIRASGRSGGDLSACVYQTILDLLANEGGVKIEAAAECLAVSPRTLQRRLAEQGTTFKEILERARGDLARRYLSERSMGLALLAEKLGYSEFSAFSRAFRRWYGTSPADWRQNSR